MTNSCRIEIQRERYKFSCAHMTVFPDGSKERLHGHNYYVGIALNLAENRFDTMVPFAPLKDALAAICDGWRERVLLAEKNPFFTIVADSPTEIEFTLCGARYVIPRDDVMMLPIENVTVEELAAHVADRLYEQLGQIFGQEHVVSFEVRVDECPGQGAVCIRRLSV